MPQADIRKEIVRVRGTQLDPEISDIMIQMIDEDVNYDMREKPQDIDAIQLSS